MRPPMRNGSGKAETTPSQGLTHMLAHAASAGAGKPNHAKTMIFMPGRCGSSHSMMRQPCNSWGSGWHKAEMQNETRKAEMPYKNTKLRYSKNTK